MQKRRRDRRNCSCRMGEERTAMLMRRQLEENHEICRMKRIERRIEENRRRYAEKYGENPDLKN